MTDQKCPKFLENGKNFQSMNIKSETYIYIGIIGMQMPFSFFLIYGRNIRIYQISKIFHPRLHGKIWFNIFTKTRKFNLPIVSSIEWIQVEALNLKCICKLKIIGLQEQLFAAFYFIKNMCRFEGLFEYILKIVNNSIEMYCFYQNICFEYLQSLESMLLSISSDLTSSLTFWSLNFKSECNLFRETVFLS